MSLAVIGAGLPRTGTWTLKLALEQLGFGPCYHMSEALQRPNDWPLWETAAAGGPVDWAALFEGWGSTTDAPACHHHQELANLYPDARLILSVRDPDQWFASTQNTILSESAKTSHESRGAGEMLKAVGWDPDDPRLHDRDFMLERYHRHNAEVRAAIPPSRLLEFQASDGWEPLCRFLGRPIPGTPFPHANSTDAFNAMIAARKTGA
jgi:hypothetical protein